MTRLPNPSLTTGVLGRNRWSVTEWDAVRFLPVWDATLLVHARRTGILSEKHRPLVFNTKTPHSAPTLLVDWAAAGFWKYEGGRVRLEPFGQLDRSTRRELHEEAERLAAFHA